MDLPPAVLGICRRLRQHGHSCYVVGGAVRDHLLGRSSPDIDLASSATPQEVQRIFRRTVPTGLAHGTITILEQRQSYEITTFRVDGHYSDGRHPDYTLHTDDITLDLSRRDFTINAIAYDPLSGHLVDPYQGQQDAGQRLIRSVGDPLVRLKEDALRMLRACRFAAQLDFAVDASTEQAIRTLAPTIHRVSAPRVTEELLKLLAAPSAHCGLELLQRTGLSAFLFPDLRWPHTWPRLMKKVARSSGEAELRLALVICFGQEKQQARPLPQLTLSNFSRDKIQCLLNQGPRVCQVLDSNWCEVDIRRLLASINRQHLDSLTAYAALLSDSSAQRLASFRQAVSRITSDGTPLSIADLNIDGRQLCQHFHRSPGPWVGTLLRQLLDRVLTHPEDNQRETLLQHAQQLRG